jgi:poly(beta-D-mannuronate) C5 epimerase
LDSFHLQHVFLTVHPAVKCTTTTHIADVNTALNNPQVLKKESSGVWLLAANLVVAKGANLVIDSSDTTWLKILSDGSVAYGLKNSGDLKIDTVKITSWNTPTNTYASPGTDGTTPRGYIVAPSGGSGKMNIFGSEIAYLGYTGTGHHGLDYYGSDGSVIQNNHIHHNWRAFYSSGVGGILIDRNNVHDNLEYGIDPHSGTHDMTITNNKSYNNNHGIICSQKCYNIHIENNEIYANNRDGIFLDAGSHHSTIANNIIY